METLKDEFGYDVARLVDGVTKLKGIDKIAGITPTAPDEARAASTRKMLVAMSEDIRVVMIKLADRLHNMRTLSHLPQARRERIAQETLDIYAPLAHRLGMSDIKWRLEDEAFRFLNPREYQGDIAAYQPETRGARSVRGRGRPRRYRPIGRERYQRPGVGPAEAPSTPLLES